MTYQQVYVYVLKTYWSGAFSFKFQAIKKHFQYFHCQQSPIGPFVSYRYISFCCRQYVQHFALTHDTDSHKLIF